MKTEICPYEAAVVSAKRRDMWNDALRQHVRDCRTCAEVAGIVGWMTTLAGLDHAISFPDPDLLWAKAKLADLEAARKRALRPVVAGEILIRALVALVAAWLIMNSAKIETAFKHLKSFSSSSVTPWPILLASLMVASLVALLFFLLQPYM